MKTRWLFIGVLFLAVLLGSCDLFNPAGGGTNNQNPVAQAGSDQTAAVDAYVFLDGSGSSDPDGSIASYSWDFGDGSSGSGDVTSHAYTAAGTYAATLTVTDDNNSTATDTLTVTVVSNLNPVAVISPVQYAVVDTFKTFSGYNSYDPDGTIISYSWDFGDGTGTAYGILPSYTYTATGSYTVTLTVTDDQGATATATLTVTVTATNQPPVANAGPDQTVVAGNPVYFDGSGSSDPDGTLGTYDYSWDFGDNTGTAYGVFPSYTYTTASTYTVTLTVTDAAGATATDTMTVTVTAAAADSGTISITVD